MQYPIYLILALAAASAFGIDAKYVSDSNPRIGNVEYIGTLCFTAGLKRVTTAKLLFLCSFHSINKNIYMYIAGAVADVEFSSWPEDNRDQRVFLFTPGTINDFFDGYNSGNCDFEALTSLNVTLSSGETAEYLDVAEGGNCDGVCSFNVELGATPQIQFVVVQCTGQEKVSLEFSIMSENAVECTKLAETPTASLMLIPVVLLAVLDIGALVAVFVTYRRKLQLEALKI